MTVDRLEQWARPGLLCIGDAAHAMSPVGGVGINLAVQDAVAAANLLWKPLTKGKPRLDDLNRVQARREFAVKATQAVQVMVQNHSIAPALESTAPLKPPFLMRLLKAVPIAARDSRLCRGHWRAARAHPFAGPCKALIGLPILLRHSPATENP